jgi:MarR family transcriptional regulator, transcriptional regulator for hemolysin
MRSQPSSHAQVRRTLGFLLHDTSRLMRRRFIQKAREAGLPLNRSEAGLLRHVAYEQGINQVTLAAHLDIEPVTVARLIDRLEADGLLERRPDPADRRVWTVWLTDAAGEMLDRIQQIVLVVRREALAGLSGAQREALTETLLAVRANLVEATDPEPGCPTDRS